VGKDRITDVPSQLRKSLSVLQEAPAELKAAAAAPAEAAAGRTATASTSVKSGDA